MNQSTTHHPTPVVSISNLSRQIALAEDRLVEKLLKLEVKSLGLSEYNQYYFANKLLNIRDVLKLYGHLLQLSLQTAPVRLDSFTLVDYVGGTGVLSLLAKELGIGVVIYNDIYNVSCKDARLLSDSLQLPFDHIVCGDIEDLTAYLRAGTIAVNAVVSYDVLEHIYDVEKHFKGLVHASLDPFRVVYASGANIENPFYVRSVTKEHRDVEYKNREKKFGAKERDTLRAYFEVRKEIIAKHAPTLNPDQVKWLAHATRGLNEADIQDCVTEYLDKGMITYHPDHPTNTCDPYTGNWCEHLMNIRWITQIVQGSGFSLKILPGYYPIAGALPKRFAKSIVNAAIHILGRQALFIAPYYVVLANR